ncbi:unnamed protein product, partial [Adineta steineri]
MGNSSYVVGDHSMKPVYEWHLNDRNDFALKKAKKYRDENEKLYGKRHPLIAFFLQRDTIIEDSAYAFVKGYLEDIKSEELGDMNKIIADFEKARTTDNPAPVLRAYSRSHGFSQQLNKDMAKNTYHALALYCTPLNCNVLARIHDGIQAFVAILFHPKLKDYLCRGVFTIYRGATIDSEELLEGYENESTIITTTFLSTSKCPGVAEMFSSLDPTKQSQISLLCRYTIHNYRRTALDMAEFSKFPHEEEVLIYPYVPFRIVSFTKTTLEPTGQKRIEVELEEINDIPTGS